MITTTVPTRFRLGAAELAGALAHAGIKPAPGCGLPAAAPLAKPTHALRAAGVLNGDHLTPEVDAALRFAAAPQRVLRILVDRPASTATHVAQLIRTPDRDEIVSWAQTDDTFDFMIVGSVNQALLLVDGLLSITDLISGDGTATFDLDVSGFAALLAAADALQEHRLRERLDRVTATTPVLTPDRLEELWQRGLTSDDSRWAAAAGRLGAPVDPASVTGRLGQGLDQLRAAKLVTANGDGDGVAPTEAGLYVLAVLGQLIATASLTLSFVEAGRTAPLAPVTIFRTATTIWAAAWTWRDSESRVTLAELTTEGALELIRDLLATINPPDRSAEQPTRAAVPEPAGTPVPASTAATASALPPHLAPAPTRPWAPPHLAPAQTQPWAPTHRVPASGLPTWDTPDGSTAPTHRLGEDLHVQVVERRGEWARVRCENDWSGWVDGRLLEPMS